MKYGNMDTGMSIEELDSYMISLLEMRGKMGGHFTFIKLDNGEVVRVRSKLSEKDYKNITQEIHNVAWNIKFKKDRLETGEREKLDKSS